VTQPAYVIFALYHARYADEGASFQQVIENLKQDTYACFFLKDDRCTNYVARPIVCRAYHSYDYEACKRDEYLKSDTLAISGFSAVGMGLESGLKEYSLDCSNVFFNRALAILLSTEDVVESWLRGENVFAPSHAEWQQ